MQRTRQDRLPGLYLIVVQGKHFVLKKVVWPYKEEGGVGEKLYVPFFNPLWYDTPE